MRPARTEDDVTAITAQAEFQLPQDRTIKFHGSEAIPREAPPARAGNVLLGSFPPPAGPACGRRIPCDKSRAAVRRVAKRCLERNRERARANSEAPAPGNSLSVCRSPRQERIFGQLPSARTFRRHLLSAGRELVRQAQPG